MKTFIGIAFWLFMIIGYIKDILHLVNCDFNPIGKAEVMYIIGACTGLGGIFGWIDFGN